MDDALSEIAIMKKLNHPNIICLYEVINDPEVDKLYLVMELAEKGQLIEWNEDLQIFEKVNTNVFIDEMFIKKVIRDSLKAINYLHKNGIIH